LFGKTEIEKEIQSITHFTDLFHFALSLNGWSFFNDTTGETQGYLKRGAENLENIIKVLEPLPDMADQVQAMREHLEVIDVMLSVVLLDQMRVASGAPEEIMYLKEIGDFIKVGEEEKRRKEILEWISPDDFWEKHRDVSAERQQGTSEAIFDTTEFKTWCNSTFSQTLWCHVFVAHGNEVASWAGKWEQKS
jgi:hypothetical protein